MIGNHDYTLRILPRADHLMLGAKVGNNAVMTSLQRFTPAYFATVQDWLAKRIRGFEQSDDGPQSTSGFLLAGSVGAKLMEHHNSR